MAGGLEKGEGEYTRDGTVDLKGNPILRRKRGGWAACSFIVVYEVFERMAYYGISSNLVLYLTDRLHQGTVEASNNVTNWVGTVFLAPIIGATVADAYFGRYWTFVFGSAIYLLGMCLLTLSVSVSPLKPEPCTANCKPATSLQLSVFFGGLYIIALGNGGTKPNVSTIGADQFDEFHPKERVQKLSFFNWWMFSIFMGTLFANTVLVYLQDNVGWTVGYGVPSLGLFCAVLIFLVGSPFYRHKLPQGSPFTRMVKVFVAAIRKWNVKLPDNPKELYEIESDGYYASKGKFRIYSTPSLRFLNKAAVKVGLDTPWMLCPVTEVEETKQILRMMPIMVSMFIPCTLVAQISTLFIKQGTTLDRHIGPNFQIPAACLSAFVTISMLVFVVLYDHYFVKVMRAWTKNPRGITILQRVGIGMFLHTLVMIIACLTERRRLEMARSYGLVENGAQLPVTIFIILPQFVLMGLSDTFLEPGKLEFFYDQAPDSMKSLGTSCSYTAFAIGNFLSSFLLDLVSNITRERGNEWIRNNLNASHLDYFYAFLAILSGLNIIFFIFVSKTYTSRAETLHSVEQLKEREGAA